MHAGTESGLLIVEVQRSRTDAREEAQALARGAGSCARHSRGPFGFREHRPHGLGLRAASVLQQRTRVATAPESGIGNVQVRRQQALTRAIVFGGDPTEHLLSALLVPNRHHDFHERLRRRPTRDARVPRSR